LTREQEPREKFEVMRPAQMRPQERAQTERVRESDKFQA
jgi:hypothetical protein